MTLVLISLLVSATPQTPVQAVSLVDLLVEAQTLYTLAVDKQPESLTAALDLARQAQRVVADDAIKKRLPAGERPSDQDLTVLGSLRARIGILVNGLEKRRDYFVAEFERIQKMLARKQYVDARAALDGLPADAPSADPACPFADLRAQLERGVALARPPASGTPLNRKGIAAGVASVTVLTVAALAAHSSMNNNLDQLNNLWPGSLDWRDAADAAEHMRNVRNGFAVAAIGAGAAFAIYGAAKASRNNSATGRSPASSRPRTLVGFNFDPRNPAISVVRIF